MTAKPIDLLLHMHSFAGGGAERVMVQLANGWARKGFRTAFAVNSESGPLRESLDPLIEVHALNPKLTALAFIPLAHLLRTLRPRATVSALDFCNVAAGLAFLMSGRQGVLMVVEHSDLRASYRARPLYKKIHLRLTIPIAYGAATIVAGVSKDAARHAAEFAGINPAKAVVVHNPVWPVRSTDRDAAEVHPWLAEDVPVLVTMGRLVAVKNHANLLQAFARVRARRDVRLLILGDGPLRAATQKILVELNLSASAQMLGFRNDVDDFLRLADAFVLSSDYEGFPLVLLEAMRHGIAIVSTQCSSGPGEILDDGHLGVLVPPRDPDELAFGIEKALDTPTPTDEMRSKVASYDIDRVADEYLRLLGLNKEN